MAADELARKMVRIRRTLRNGGNVRLRVVLRGRERRQKGLAHDTAMTMLQEIGYLGHLESERVVTDGIKLLISPSRRP